MSDYDNKHRKCLIDGDIIAYRAAFSAQDGSALDAQLKADDLVTHILDETVPFWDVGDYVVYITGEGNFRHSVAKTATYKGNRKDTTKPQHLPIVRKYLRQNWKAVMSQGEEADDLISKEATRLDYNCVVASIDKDMLQLPCWHFNFVKGEFTEVEPFEGTKFFYTQILTGDSADNIKGLYRVGPVKAAKILDGCETEGELWEACVKAYDGDVDRVLENARLLWLRRYDNEMWEPPV